MKKSLFKLSLRLFNRGVSVKIISHEHYFFLKESHNLKLIGQNKGVFMTIIQLIQTMFFISFTFTSFTISACENHLSNSVWHWLKSGNQTFVNNYQYAKTRSQLTSAQNPPCIVLSCSDSRVPPEITFQKDLGQLFTVRVAGHVADDVVIDTIEYAVTHFDSSLIVVMGHTDCGAVIGALKHLIKNNGKIDKAGQGHLDAVLIPIETAIVESKIDIYAPDALKLSIQANIAYVARRLIDQSSKISNAVSTGKLRIIGAEYDLKTGEVNQLFILR